MVCTRVSIIEQFRQSHGKITAGKHQRLHADVLNAVQINVDWHYLNCTLLVRFQQLYMNFYLNHDHLLSLCGNCGFIVCKDSGLLLQQLYLISLQMVCMERISFRNCNFKEYNDVNAVLTLIAFSIYKYFYLSEQRKKSVDIYKIFKKEIKDYALSHIHKNFLSKFIKIL